jgi:TRAP-type C4-dicarboxylate transport system permease small subunit
MRKILNCVYDAAGWLACIFFVLIGVFVIANVVGRQIGVAFRSADEFAGYCMSASAFLGLAATFRDRIHVRVTLLIDQFNPHIKARFDVVCLLAASIILAYLTYHTAMMTWFSWDFEEKTQGMLPIPLWIPQMGMLLGMFFFMICCIDGLIMTLRGKPDQFYTTPAQQNQAE